VRIDIIHSSNGKNRRLKEREAVKVNKPIDAEILHDIITDHELCSTQKEELEKAIEKLTSKKINKSSFNVAFCPMCHGAVWQLRHESKYCFRCGQALDWSVEE